MSSRRGEILNSYLQYRDGDWQTLPQHFIPPMCSTILDISKNSTRKNASIVGQSCAPMPQETNSYTHLR